MDRVLERIRRQAQDPARVAIIEPGQTLTYADLDARSDSLAALLSRKGVAAGDCVALLRRTMTSAYVTTLASVKAGHLFLLIDANDSDTRRSDVTRQAKPKVLLIESDADASFARGLGIPAIDLRDVPPARFDAPVLAPGAPCWIEPTSGSTGTAKLVLSSRAVLEHLCFAQLDAAGIGPDDRVALFGEMWVDALMNPAMAGATLLPYDLKATGIAPLPEWMREQRISAVQTFVAAFRSLAAAADAPLPDLRIVRIAGEVVTAQDVALFERICPEGAVLTNFYGSTECGFIAEYRHVRGAELPGPTLPIGKPLPGTRIEIVDENRAPLPQGVAGLMLVKSRHLADGYLNNPEKTAETYWTEPDGMRVLNTGDLAFLGDDGNFRVVGRADDQVKIRGYSVRYSDVEAILSQHPDLSQVAVTSFLSPRGQRQLAAHVIPRPGAAAPDFRDLRRWVSERGPAYLAPSYFVLHESFPRTDTGKILRRALPDPLDGLTQDAGFADQLTGTRARVAEIWRDTLGHAAFSADEDFFDVGGDSLQAMTMVVALERAFKVRIGYESLVMKGATIESIAERIDRARDAASPFLDLKPGTSDHPIHVMPVENGEFSDWLYMLKHFGPDIPLRGVHVRDISKRDAFPRRSAAELGRYAADSIRNADPDGPFFVAGFSAGCQTAFECARHIQASGGRIAGLLLLDPPVIPLEPYRRTWALRRMFSPLVKSGDLALTLNRMGHILFGRPASELHIADETTFWTYRPTPCPIPGTLMVSARDLNAHRAEKETEWRRLVGPDMQVAETPGDHITIVREPNAAVLARIIDRWWRDRVARFTTDAA